jgi:catecholate siderophore receptor
MAKKFTLLPLGAMLSGLALGQTAGQTAVQPALEQTLPQIDVRDQREQARTYQPGVNSTTKLPLLPRDIPASITTVPEQLIYDRGVDNFRDALRYVPGITFQAGEGGRIGDNIRLRGYSVVNDLYIDGVRDTAQYNRDVFNLEQIDVLRGSASMLFGRGTTGGVINQVSKKPFLYDGGKAAYTFGNNDYNRLTADLNKVIGENTAIRLNVMKTDADSFRDVAHTSRTGIAPSVRWGIGTQDEFTLSHYYLAYRDVPDYGVPMSTVLGGPVPVPVNRFYGLGAVDYQIDSASISTAEWIHRFSSDTSVKTVLRHGYYERDLRAVNPGVGAASVFNDNTVVTRGRQTRGGEDRGITLQSDLTTKTEFGGFKHLLLAGYEYQTEDSYRWNYVATGNANPPTTLNPNPYPALPASFFTSWKQRTGEVYFNDWTTSFYLQDMIDLTKNWKVLLGTRYDNFRASYKPATPPSFQRTDKVWSYRSGLLWQPSDFQSYYASLGNSFNPSAESYAIAGNNVNTPPEKNLNMEIGGKWEAASGNLSLSAALFRTEKTNERNTDPSNAGTLVLSGRRHTQGLELSAAGRITSRWEVFGGYALMSSRIDEHVNPAYVGIVAQNTPPYSLNAWSTYRLDGGWKIGGGMEMVGNRTVYGFGNISPTSAPPVYRVAPHYTRWDAMLSYEQKNYDIKFNITNLFNTTWYDAPYENGGHVVPGTSRTGLVTLAWKY